MTLFFILIFICLLCSAFFSGSETALTGASNAIIHKKKTEGSKRALLVSKIRERKERLIGTILLGNNAVNIAASTMATSLAIHYWGDDEWVLTMVTVVMTLVVLVFGEVLPKTYAIRNAEKVAFLVSPIFILLMRVMTPITRLVEVLVEFFLWIFRLRGQDDNLKDTTELRGAIELHHAEGAVVKNERDMLGSILDLEEIEVGEVMTHRKDMITIDASLSLEKIAEFVFSSQFTRFPVWRENPDNIIGILHSKNLIASLYGNENAEPVQIDEILNQPWFVPETTTLMEQLQAFRAQHAHMAMVVDEYGALLGMVTLEDVLEEIVGQIEDESDIRTLKIRQQKDGGYVVEGRLTIRDINRELSWNLPDAEASTVAGLIVHEAQQIPDVGQMFHFHGCKFQILKRKRNQLVSIKMWKFDETLGNES